jgi:imidazolonepropionase-like amidohydrolase
MDGERIVPGQTLIVRGDRIREIGPVDATEIPEGAVRIDGSGKYLMPGLADMHVHFNYLDMAIPFLANGVTTVRNMWGTDWHLSIRDTIQKGEVLGPTIHTTGPVIDGNPAYWPGSEVVESPDQAARVVAEHKKAGYESIKIYSYLSVECFDALIDAAAKQGMTAVGHIPEKVSIEHALDSGMYCIEHLEGYGPFLKLGPSYNWSDAEVDKSKMSSIAKDTSKAGVWNCPTLLIGNDRGMSNMKKMVKALHDAGAKILLGTDAVAHYVVPGFSIHEELQNFVDAGLTPYEAIRTGTRAAAEFLNEVDEFGTVGAGLRADLILVERNPLEDVSHMKKIAGVMVRGRWIPKKEIQERLDREAASNKPPENRFADVPAIKIEGEKVFSGRYELISRDEDTKKGEERIVVAKMPDGKKVVYAQLVMDPPLNILAYMELAFDETGKCYSLDCNNKAPMGKAVLRIRRKDTELTVTRKPLSGEETKVTETIAEEILLGATLLGADMAGSIMPLVQIAETLKAGDTRNIKSKTLWILPQFEVLEETMTIEKAEDGTRQTQEGPIPIRIFSIHAKSKRSEYKASIVLDQEGHLLELKRQSRMGTIKFVRIE